MYVLELTKGRAWLPCLLGKTQPPCPKVLQVFWGNVKAMVRGGGWSWSSQREANISTVSFQMLPKSGESAALSG